MIITGITFIAIGSAKSKWSTVSWWRSGLTTLLVGAIAAALAYAAGMLFRGFLDGAA
jgi:VIT1/CCC1 family predicted Fe2+/Mn2+ transporter